MLSGYKRLPCAGKCVGVLAHVMERENKCAFHCQSLLGPLQFQCEKVRLEVRVRLFVVIVGLR